MPVTKKIQASATGVVLKSPIYEALILIPFLSKSLTIILDSRVAYRTTEVAPFHMLVVLFKKNLEMQGLFFSPLERKKNVFHGGVGTTVNDAV